MQIQAETLPQHAIQSYTSTSVRIAGETYTDSLLVSAESIHSPLPLHTLAELNPEVLLAQFRQHPKILIIGHCESSTLFLSPEHHLTFMRQGIGVECMSLDAACRTFNILLGEHREVALLLILPLTCRIKAN